MAGGVSPEPTSGQGELPDGSFVTPEAVQRFREILGARERGELGDFDPAPDKADDQWTSSRALREDLVEQLTNFAENLTVLEVGSYFGYTTRLLSSLFHRVVAIDAFSQFLQANREFNADRNNIFYLKFDTVKDSWDMFAANTIHVVFLDASHDYLTVRHDLENCLKFLPSVSLLIFDDYGAEEGVRLAVHEFVASGRLRPIMPLGEGKHGPWRLRDGRTIVEREAIACEVVRGAS